MMKHNECNHDSNAASPSPASSSKLRRWIVPTFGGRGWKSRLRWILLRLLGYYVLIVIGIALFQRHLIYNPLRAAAIPLSASLMPEGSVHDIVVTTDDGLNLHGWHLLPIGERCDDPATCDAALRGAKLVVLYFGSNSGNRSERVAEFRSFLELGAHVLVFDYRGYGENPGSPSESHFTIDARAMWKFATQERGLSSRQIVIFGESLGGAVATRLAAEQSDAGSAPRGLILCGTFSSLADVGADRFPWMPVRLLLVDRYPSTDLAHSITCPVLQFHGDQDDIVPIAFGRRLHSAIPKQSADGVPKQFVELVGSGHNDFAESRFREPVGAFFERLNGI